MDSDSSETNLVIVTTRERYKLFCKIYWRIFVVIITPLALLPIAFVGENNAYTTFYIFLVTIIYWLTDAIHPGVSSLLPIAMFTIFGYVNTDSIGQVYVHRDLWDSLGVMMIIAAVEYSQVHMRLALKLLLVFGCSHYRLSFMLFFTCMFLSMWISSTVACGLMMPVVKAILLELEKMGILEIYQTIGKAQQKSIRHEVSVPRPTDFTIFYFLGVAYSSSIGSMATITGSESNQILKIYSEMIFPLGPKIGFPHFMLLNLPGVLLMETLVYIWMNFYFLGMFRSHSDIALEIGITEEESQYINSLITMQYQQLGKMKFHEIIVSVLVIFHIILQIIVRSYINDHPNSEYHWHIKISAPIVICVILLFIAPINLNFVKFFKKHNSEPLPSTPSKACLNWNLVRSYVNWSVLFLIGSSCSLFEVLKDSKMTNEFEGFLLLFKNWPTSALIFIVILFCKFLTEFASNSCVVRCILPNIARLGVLSNVNPHYLMMAATLSCGLPFHLLTGSAANVMVAAYVHIPPWKMMEAGIGPSVISIVVIWCTITVWSKAIWTNINLDPNWVHVNVLFNK